MIRNLIKKISAIIKNKKDDYGLWREVTLIDSLPWLLWGFFPVRILLLVIMILIELIFLQFLSEFISHIINVSLINIFFQIIILILNLYIPYKSIRLYWLYRKKKKSNEDDILNCLRYVILSLELYDEDVIVNDKARKERRIKNVIGIFFKEDDFKIYVRVIKDGGKYNKVANTLGENFQSALGKKLQSTYDGIDYCQYEFKKEEIKQFVFNNLSLDRSFFENVPLDMIQLSNTQSFSLKKNTNLGIYGRTGTGKTIGLQWYLYNAVAKGCGSIGDSVLSIVDGKGADLFSLGELLQKELGENVSVGQTPTSLVKLSREFVQIMNNRFDVIKHNNTLNADAYDLGMIPNFLFIDELASIKDSCGSDKKGKDLWNEILQNLGLIARMGRMASCHLCLATQDPNSDNIPVELRNQISSVIFLGNPSNDRLKMAFSMCELENVPTISGRKGEALFFADGNNNMVEPEIAIVPFVDVKTKKDFIDVIRNIKPI